MIGGLTGFTSVLRSTLTGATSTSYAAATAAAASNFMVPLFGVRWGSRGGNRGDTYQPNTLKRKRRLGFLARAKSRSGRQVLKRRFEKGRWFLTH